MGHRGFRERSSGTHRPGSGRRAGAALASSLRYLPLTASLLIPVDLAFPWPLKQSATASWADTSPSPTGLTGLAVNRQAPRLGDTRPRRPKRRHRGRDVIRPPRFPRDLTRAFNLAPADSASFADTAGSVHGDAINRVAAAGIITGYADGTFRADHTVTRGQMATFLMRVVVR
jgi:hypothetical protein